jgi:maltoporin
MKLVLYGEHHSVAEGTRRTDDVGFLETLPADDGYVVGAQVGGWMVEKKAFVNLFARYARGLGATNPLGIPFRVGSVTDTARAEELVLSLSANYEHDFFGIQAGAYFRRYRDPDPSVLDRSAIAEGAFSLRPYVWFLDWLGLAADLSFQALETTALDPTTGNVEGGSIWKIGLLPFVSPFGRGTYTRPHLRIIYTAAFRDEGAMSLLNDLDPRSTRSVEHFLGIGAEWWIDSSSYSAP